MKYIKTFEFVSNNIEVPVDYYIIPRLIGDKYDDKIKSTLNNNIYRIINKNSTQYKIDYNDYFHQDGMWIDKNEVNKFSSIKTTLDSKLQIIRQKNNYNK